MTGKDSEVAVTVPFSSVPCTAWSAIEADFSEWGCLEDQEVMVNGELKEPPRTDTVRRNFINKWSGRIALMSTSEGVYNPAEAAQDMYNGDGNRIDQLASLAHDSGAELYVVDAGHVDRYESIASAYDRIALRLGEIAVNRGVNIAVRNASIREPARNRRYAIGTLSELFEFGHNYGFPIVPTFGLDDDCEASMKEVLGRGRDTRVGAVILDSVSNRSIPEGMFSMVERLKSASGNDVILGIDSLLERSRIVEDAGRALSPRGASGFGALSGV
jgi:hypothetical protein